MISPFSPSSLLIFLMTQDSEKHTQEMYCQETLPRTMRPSTKRGPGLPYSLLRPYTEWYTHSHSNICWKIEYIKEFLPVCLNTKEFSIHWECCFITTYCFVVYVFMFFGFLGAREQTVEPCRPPTHPLAMSRAPRCAPHRNTYRTENDMKPYFGLMMP